MSLLRPLLYLSAGAWLAFAHPAAGQQAAEDRPPRLLNADEAEREILAAYPAALRATARPSEAGVRFTIRADGSVDSASVAATWISDSAFVAPAEAVARRLRFTPRLVAGNATPALYHLRIRFYPSRQAADSAGYASAVSAADLHLRLLNTDAIARQLSERYPPALLERRVSGAVRLRFRIRTDGLVDSASLSAVQATDSAFVERALAIGRQLEFTPTVLGGRPEEFWYTFDLRFLPTRDDDPRGDRQPRLRNGGEVDRLVAQGYPPEMEMNRVWGAVLLRFRIQANGRVDAATVLPMEWTDTAFVRPAAEVARRMTFEPATADGRPVAYWHSFVIHFGRPPEIERSTPPDEGTYEMAAVEVLPRLRNGAEVTRQITALYPPALADSGIGGEVVLRFRVMEDGRVDPATVAVDETTHPALAEPGREIVLRMRFSPAMVNNRPVPVWITLPLRFSAPAPAPDDGNPPGG